MAATLARSHRSKAREPEGGTALLKVGDLLAGKYRVERILGEGGMGVVVAAHHELLDQHVAVKLLYQDIADREAQSRLLLEARACAKLQSEHVARVVDVDTGADGLPFIVMELLDGADLCQIADARGALPRWLVVDYMLQTLEGLAHAHSRGIVHRDLKPSNLFLANRADGTQIIKILDFGISKSTDPAFDSTGERKKALQLTGGRAVLGSPPYMSPEQVRSPKTVDHRTDIWSLGIVMYELLTNSMPFGGEEINETFAQILEKEPQPIRQIVNGVPEGLERIVMRCLAKNRDNRFADVSELARALVAFGSGTWMQSADRVHATLTRGLEEAISGPRIKHDARGGHPSSMGGMPIPSSPGQSRRLDSMQPELTGTASTVARRFTVLGTKGKWMLGASVVFCMAAGMIVAGAAFRQSRAAVIPETSPVASADPPAEATGVPVVGNGTGVVTPPPHIVGAENESPPTSAVQGGVNVPVGTVIGASAPAAVTPQGATPNGTNGPSSAGAPSGSAPRKPLPVAAPRAPIGPAPAVRRPPAPASAGKPLLPAGLPRDRDGR